LIHDVSVDFGKVMDDDEYSPLHEACDGDDLEEVGILIGNGADVLAVNKYGTTPLHHACDNGNLEIAKLLVDSGADISHANWYGYTPLHEACSNGYSELIKFLVENGADISAVDENGNTPLQLMDDKQREDVERHIVSLNLWVKPAKR
jgi:ankyrin repeat protein